MHIVNSRLRIIVIILLLIFSGDMFQQCSAISIEYRQQAEDQDIKMQNFTTPSKTTKVPTKKIQCVRHLEYAAFIHKNGVKKLEDNEDQEPMVHSFENKNGNTKYYICKPCSQCGEGVVKLAPCRLESNTVCAPFCIYNDWEYDPSDDQCHPVSAQDIQQERLPQPTRSSSSDAPLTSVDSPLDTSEPNHFKTTWQSTRANSGIEGGHVDGDKTEKTHVMIATITIGVITLNLMLLIFLIQYTRYKRHKNSSTSVPPVQNGLNQNNHGRLTDVTDTLESHICNHPCGLAVQIESPPCPASLTPRQTAMPNLGPHPVKECNVTKNVTINSSTGTQAGSSINAEEMQVQVRPGTEPYWIEMSGYFGPQGGTLSCDESDVIIDIPPGAIPATHPRQLITAKVSRTPGIFSINLDEGGLFLSPLVDCESPGLKRFKKDITIKLPHRAHLRPDWTFVVHYTNESSPDVRVRGSDWNVVVSSCETAKRDPQGAVGYSKYSENKEVQFTVDTKYVYITTPHFSKYTCSGCGEVRELSFEAVVYINDVHLDAGRRVDLHCYLLDIIKDFQWKVDVNESGKPRTSQKALIIDVKKGKEVEVAIMDMGGDWPWEIDERVHKAVQTVDIDDLVRCHADLMPDFTTFTLRPRQPIFNGDHGKASSCLETHVSIKQKSHSKSIIIDIATDLDGCSTISNATGTREDLEIGLAEAFSALSKKLTANQWKPLFRSLMSTDKGCPVNVEAMISSLMIKEPNDLEEQIYSGLMTWYRSCRKQHTTIQKLCQCLQKEKLESVAAEIRSVYQTAAAKVCKVRDRPRVETRSPNSSETVF